MQKSEKKTENILKTPLQKIPKKNLQKSPYELPITLIFDPRHQRGRSPPPFRTKKLQNSLRKNRPFFSILRFFTFLGWFWGGPKVDKKVIFYTF